MTRKALLRLAAVAVLAVVFTAGFTVSAVALNVDTGTCPADACGSLAGYTFDRYCYFPAGGEILRCAAFKKSNSPYDRCYTQCQPQ